MDLETLASLLGPLKGSQVVVGTNMKQKIFKRQKTHFIVEDGLTAVLTARFVAQWRVCCQTTDIEQA